jgi:hypothetical protein
MSWYRAPLWDLWPDITSYPNVPVWNLRSCFCGAPSLTRGRVCNLQWNHSMVWVAQNPYRYFTLSSETLPTWRAKSLYTHPPGTGRSSPKSSWRYDLRSDNHYVPVSSPRSIRGVPSERISIWHQEVYTKAKFLVLPLWGLHVKLKLKLKSR